MDLCFENLGRKPKDPATIHVMGKLSELMIDQRLLAKYNDPRNPILIVYIDGVGSRKRYIFCLVIS